MKRKRILILGCTGMFGSTLSTFLSEKKYKIFLVGKDKKKILLLKKKFKNIYCLDLTNFKEIEKVIKKIQPNFIINASGIVKSIIKKTSRNYVIILNALLPKYLSTISNKYNFKLIHISTDCVFSGKEGNYCENSLKDAEDFYGLTKSIGEISNCANSLTLRTSIIGHELKNYSSRGLLEWVLKFRRNKKKVINGYAKAFFSGLTTLELSKIIEKYFLKDKFNSGLINVG